MLVRNALLAPLTLALIVLASGASNSDGDPNFITKEELPIKVRRSFSLHGRGKLPYFREGYGIDEATTDKLFERVCLSTTGAQLSDWHVATEDHVYWSYEISAWFACNPPQTETALQNGAAEALYEALKVDPIESSGGTQNKSARVLCYDYYEPVCLGTTLQRYKTHQVCEISDLNSGDLVSLEDVLDREPEVVNGALKLRRQIPVYADSRRDDKPSHRCAVSQWDKLKGLSRHAAIIHCSKHADATVCQVNGMIKIP